MDGLLRYLHTQTDQENEASLLGKYLIDQAYDTESLMEDIPKLNGEDEKNSMLFQNGQFNSMLLHLVQKYIHYQKCMQSF